VDTGLLGLDITGLELLLGLLLLYTGGLELLGLLYVGLVLVGGFTLIVLCGRVVFVLGLGCVTGLVVILFGFVGTTDLCGLVMFTRSRFDRPLLPYTLPRYVVLGP